MAKIRSEHTNHDPHNDVRSHILEAVMHMTDCDLEELVRVSPSYTWNQVFLEVDRLSRTGELRLFPKGKGQYSVRLPLPTAV